MRDPRAYRFNNGMVGPDKDQRAVLPIHKTTVNYQVFELCTECGRNLAEKYVDCDCGAQLHIKCIPTHKRKMRLQTNVPTRIRH